MQNLILIVGGFVTVGVVTGCSSTSSNSCGNGHGGGETAVGDGGAPLVLVGGGGSGGFSPFTATTTGAPVCDPPCDDGNPCTVDECVNGECVFPNDTEFPACDDGHAVCISGACCAAPKCFSKGACVDACPLSETCGPVGVCK